MFYAQGFSKIVCFKTETTKLLHLTKQDQCDNDDLDIAISRVAKAIQAENKYNKKKRESYTIDIDRDIVCEPVSETLLDLLIKISPKFHESLLSLMIGNIVASTVNSGVAMCRNKTLI